MTLGKEYYGFTGKILKINLSTSQVSTEDIDLNYAEAFIGGAGYACRYLYDHINKDTDPLSPDNILMVMTGPFCLTTAPSFGRFVICSKSPYTDLWGEANCGGFFGPELKKAGFDGIIITGKSEKPVYIKITNENVEILDASEFWGKGTKHTQRRLKNLSELPKSRVLCIGQGGENLVKYATINADGRSAGRTGMGAVMGSKNLKAIIVKGGNFKPKVAHPEKFKAQVKTTIQFILKQNTTKALREFGTSVGVMSAHGLGDLPIKYWSQGEWDKVFDISGQKLKDNHVIKKKSCYGCSIGCGRIVKINDKKYSFPECEGPEYETIAGFGSMLLINDLEAISIANNLCNDYGIDTISTSGVIALLYDLYDKKKINKDDIDGLNPSWGNSQTMLKLIEKIAFKEGIGKLLAEGSNIIGQKFNIPRDDIASINKMEIPYHDIRSCYGLALTYAFSPRGACHMVGDVWKILRKGHEIDFSEIGISKLDMFSNKKDMAIGSALVHDYRALYSSLISCAFSNPPPSYMAKLVEFLLGFEFSLEHLKKTGGRIFNMKRLFNIKMGLTSENDFVPKILLTPTKEGAVKGKAPDFEKLKKHYYNVRNWDPSTGKPNEEKLKELGLNNL